MTIYAVLTSIKKELIQTCYTFERRPLSLVYVEEFDHALDAIMHEKQLKGWGRAKKKH